MPYLVHIQFEYALGMTSHYYIIEIHMNKHPLCNNVKLVQSTKDVLCGCILVCKTTMDPSLISGCNTKEDTIYKKCHKANWTIIFGQNY